MARLGNTSLNGASGTLGDLILYQRNGVTYVRRKPQKWSTAKKNSTKVSPANKRAQSKFALAQKYLKGLNRVIRFGYQNEVFGAKTARNACISHLLINGFGFNGAEYFVDPSLVKMSIGSLMEPEEAKAIRTEEGVVFTWKDNSWSSSAKPDDRAFLVLHNPLRALAEYREIGNYRTKGKDILSNQLINPDQEWHAYLAFSQENPRTKKRILSNSVYLGLV